MEDTNALAITDDQMNLIRRTVANGATESELSCGPAQPKQGSMPEALTRRLKQPGRN